MVSGHTGNVVPRKGLRVRAPCPPLVTSAYSERVSVDSSTGAFSHFWADFWGVLPKVLPKPLYRMPRSLKRRRHSK